jgi:hypothetical protein
MLLTPLVWSSTAMRLTPSPPRAILFGLRITGSGGLTINAVAPPAPATVQSASAAAGIDVQSAAVSSLVAEGSANVYATATDPTILSDVASSLLASDSSSTSHKSKQF